MSTLAQFPNNIHNENISPTEPFLRYSTQHTAQNVVFMKHLTVTNDRRGLIITRGHKMNVSVHAISTYLKEHANLEVDIYN